MKRDWCRRASKKVFVVFPSNEWWITRQTERDTQREGVREKSSKLFFKACMPVFDCS